ncbi:MAG: hypothetical protein AAF961_16845, partial [Planctomycetota bacterium]
MESRIALSADFSFAAFELANLNEFRQLWRDAPERSAYAVQAMESASLAVSSGQLVAPGQVVASGQIEEMYSIRAFHELSHALQSQRPQIRQTVVTGLETQQTPSFVIALQGAGFGRDVSIRILNGGHSELGSVRIATVHSSHEKNGGWFAYDGHEYMAPVAAAMSTIMEGDVLRPMPDGVRFEQAFTGQVSLAAYFANGTFDDAPSMGTKGPIDTLVASDSWQLAESYRAAFSSESPVAPAGDAYVRVDANDALASGKSNETEAPFLEECDGGFVTLDCVDEPGETSAAVERVKKNERAVRRLVDELRAGADDAERRADSSAESQADGNSEVGGATAAEGGMV